MELPCSSALSSGNGRKIRQLLFPFDRSKDAISPLLCPPETPPARPATVVAPTTRQSARWGAANAELDWPSGDTIYMVQLTTLRRPEWINPPEKETTSAEMAVPESQKKMH